MSRINLATDLKTRTGAPDKDARLKNSYVETRGEQSVVRKRPIAQGGVVVGSGVPQGGYGIHLFWDDTLYTITEETFTTCSGVAKYSVGDHVTVDMVDYWATTDHVGNCPIGGENDDWSRNYISGVPPVSGWTIGTVPFTPYFGNNTIAWNGSVFCYIGENPDTGYSASVTSSDGIHWTQHADLAISFNAGGHCAINWNGAQFIATGDTGGDCITITSADGISWTTHYDGATPVLYDISWNGSIYCAVANDGNAYTSATGSTWVQHVLPSGSYYRAITFNGTVFCVVSSFSNVACVSADGTSWTASVLPYSTAWIWITSAGGLLCSTNNNGSSVSVSIDDGATWTGAMSSGLSAIKSSNSLIIAVYSQYASSTYQTSTDGETWTARTLPQSQVWSLVGYGSGKGFVVIDNTTVSAFSVTGL